jgi:hypothetical protein
MAPSAVAPASRRPLVRLGAKDDRSASDSVDRLRSAPASRIALGILCQRFVFPENGDFFGFPFPVPSTPQRTKFLMKSRLLLVAAVVFASSLIASVGRATVLRVVVVQTDDVAAYEQQIERGKALLKKLGSPAILRLWRARFAGEQAGSVVVSVEFPDLVAFANDDRKTSADPEYQAWLKGLGKIRKIISDSLYDELTP